MTFQIKQSVLAASVAIAIAAPISGFATNGMLLEGYGPIATGMGGASMAYDNGVAAVMNNPATLGLMEDGESRLDVAVGILAPDITSSHPVAGDADSSATSFLMPAVGYAVRNKSLTYGVGMFAQGGMGTEYAADSFLAAGSAELVRSEVGVARIVAPITYNVNKKLIVGGSFDYVMGGMDLKMAMSGAQFYDFVSTQQGGTASGGLADGFGGMLTNTGAITPVVNADGSVSGAFDLYNTRFDFSNDDDFSGEAKGAGFASKIGFTYKINNNLSVGGTYHTKTDMGDLESSNAALSMGTSLAVEPITVNGKIAVNDFQFPAQIGLGMAYQQDKWMFAADVKIIQWADVMDSFNMTFTADGAAAQTGMGVNFADQELNVEMYQNWEDQTVIQLGGAYKVSSATTLRAGINSSSNPVPDATLNPLFPATIENHITLGLGQATGKTSGIDFSLTIAPEVSVAAGSGVTTTHAQTNWQLMYSQKF